MMRLDGISVKFGGVTALDAVSATFTAPVSGIIGPNGAGKTTLMNVISGFLRAAGTMHFGDTDLLAMPPYLRARWGLRRSFQKEQIADDLSVADNVRVVMDSLTGTPSQKQADLARALDVAGLTDKARVLGRDLNTFERRLADVARCLVGHPRLVVFDEPAGGLGTEETARLGDLIVEIRKLTGAMTLVIDHDVELISRICSDILVLDFGKRIAFGPTLATLGDSKVRAAYLGLAEEVA